MRERHPGTGTLSSLPIGRASENPHPDRHTHWNHIQGFPFFTPVFLPGTEINIYAPRASSEALKMRGRNRCSISNSPLSWMISRAGFITPNWTKNFPHRELPGRDVGPEPCSSNDWLSYHRGRDQRSLRYRSRILRQSTAYSVRPTKKFKIRKRERFK